MSTTSVSAVFCKTCGELIDEGVNVCARCGAPRPRESFFYPLAMSKFVFFGATTFGIYLLWWFWSQWRAEAPNEGRGSAALKTLLSTIFFYSMARQVKEEGEKHGIVCRYSPAVLTAVVWTLAVTVRVASQPRVVLPAVIAFVAPYIPVQRAINRINAAMSADQRRRGGGGKLSSPLCSDFCGC